MLKFESPGDYFDNIDSEEKAYWLGLLAADGYLNPNYVSIALKAGDRELLQKFAETFKVPIKDYAYTDKRTNKIYPHCKVYVYRKRLVNKLQEIYKLKERAKKSKELTGKVFERIPSYLMHHFIRGFFDGDGSIGIFGGMPTVTLCGTTSFLKALSKQLKLKKLKLSKVYDYSSLSILHIRDKKSIKSFVDYLYSDSSIFLPRKKEKSFQIVTYYMFDDTGKDAATTIPVHSL